MLNKCQISYIKGEKRLKGGMLVTSLNKSEKVKSIWILKSLCAISQIQTQIIQIKYSQIKNWTNVFWRTGLYFGAIIKHNFGAMVSVLMNSSLFYQTENCGIGLLTFARTAVRISLAVSFAEFEP